MVKENEMKRIQLQNQHEEDVERLEDKLHKVERQVRFLILKVKNFDELQELILIIYCIFSTLYRTFI